MKKHEIYPKKGQKTPKKGQKAPKRGVLAPKRGQNSLSGRGKCYCFILGSF